MSAGRTPQTLRGRWLAITAATAVYQFSYWPIFAGTSAPDGSGVGLIAFGMALVPFVFLVAAFTTQHPNAPGGTLRAMGWFLLVGLPVGVFTPVIGVCLGVCLGAAVALAPLPEHDTRRTRYLTVLGVALYLLVLLVVSPGFLVISGAVLPIAVHGMVDQAVEDRERSRARSGA